LKRELHHYEKDKLTLRNAKARLKLLEEKHTQSTWEQEILEQKFAQAQKERDEIYGQFVDRIISVQQKTGLKNLVILFINADFGKEGG
jgi:growth arrest-specific protein 8